MYFHYNVGWTKLSLIKIGFIFVVALLISPSVAWLFIILWSVLTMQWECCVLVAKKMLPRPCKYMFVPAGNFVTWEKCKSWLTSKFPLKMPCVWLWNKRRTYHKIKIHLKPFSMHPFISNHKKRLNITTWMQTPRVGPSFHLSVTP